MELFFEQYNIHKKWHKFFYKESMKPYFEKIINLLDEYDSFRMFPRQDKIFKVFSKYGPKKIKCVILGQDPYINYIFHKNSKISQANGLSFSVSKKFKIPPSLKNIYKELEESTGFKKPDHGDLSSWFKYEKVMLLNSALSVEEGKSNSHASIWKEFTDNVIQYISKKNKHCVFILWGNFSKSKSCLVDNKKHLIIKGVHPSPLSARYNRKGEKDSFFGHNYFNKTNDFLKSKGIEIIDWQI